MIRAGIAAWATEKHGGGDFAPVYRAMLEAAPAGGGER